MKNNKKTNTIEVKVHEITKKMFTKGKLLPITKIAKKLKISPEWARINILKLQAKGKITRDNQGHIIKVK